MATLKEQMIHWRGVARQGDPEACRESMAGTVRQESPFRTEGRFGHHTIYVDEPKSFGGSDTAANPAEVMMTGLCASIAVTLRCHAALLGVRIGAIEMTIAGNLDVRGFFDADPKVRSGFKALDIGLRLESDASPAQLKRLMAAVERGCPVLDAVREPTPVKLELLS
ncbi:MAG TPA: OsmC family protein [Kiloniellales bacterium]|nr:OsmC family protein [Kiloniellales bacterium]